MKLISLFAVFVFSISFNASAVQDERFVIDKTTFSVSEDGVSDSFSLSLAKAPTEDVVVSFIDETNEAIVNGTFTFTSSNWNVAQTVIVKGVADNIIDGDQDFNLEIRSSSNDGDFVSKVKQIAAGSNHSCALYEGGEVRCWGDGYYGQLGYGNTTSVGDGKTITSSELVNVGGLVKQISAGSRHTCALLETGSVRCWGDGSLGQLGHGNTYKVGDDETPASVGDIDVGGVVIQISAGGNNTCALLETGAVRCWGINIYGQLGYGNTDAIGDGETPASAGDIDVGGVVKQIFTGSSHTCALLETGAVRCWGRNSFGQLGYGHTRNIGDNETPASLGDVYVDVGGTVTEITVGGDHSCALLSTGTVKCWGWSHYGQLGYGNSNTIGNDETPASAGDVDVGGIVTQISAGDYHTCALLETGAVHCWGYNNYGQLGYGNTEIIGNNETPASAGDIDVGGSVQQIIAGYNHNCALLESGKIKCWGLGSLGQLGSGSTDNVGDDETLESVVDVKTSEDFAQISLGGVHTCVLLESGKVRCWGYGYYGSLGYANTDNIGDNEAPASAGYIDVGGIVTQIATGNMHTCALLESGEVSCWGYGYYGQLGNGSSYVIGNDETPASAGIVFITEAVTQITAGYNHTCALLESGDVKCWGRGAYGALGYGDTQTVKSPMLTGYVDIGGVVKQISAGGNHTCALLETGGVRCWGRNDYGQLGYGNTENIGDTETPSSAGDINISDVLVTQVISGENHTCVLLEDGSVKCWGLGGEGQLGYGNINNIGDDETPVDVGNVDVGGNATQIAAGEAHTCALLESGAMRCWGYNGYGQLGYGNSKKIGDTETPASAGDIDVGGIVTEIAGGGNHTCVIIKTGSVRCWGESNYGMLGYGSYVGFLGDNETPASVGDVEVIYKNINLSGVTQDTNTAEIIITSSSLYTTEIGGKVELKVNLSSIPSADVNLSFSSSAITEGILDSSTFVFTKDNWNVEQSVFITGIDDAINDGDISYTIDFLAESLDLNFNGAIENVTLINSDDDDSGITIETTSDEVSESGASAILNILLDSEPTDTVTLNFANSDLTEGALSINSISFDKTNWNVVQQIVVTGLDDAIDDGDISFDVTVSSTSSDANYENLAQIYSYINLDDDLSGVLITPTGLEVSEIGGNSTLGVVLKSEPVSKVTFDIVNSDLTEGTLSTSSISFDNTNWNVVQQIVVTGLDDAIDDGDISFDVTVSSTSSDANYENLAQIYSYINLDDDLSGILITPAGLEVSEIGEGSTFSVVLKSEPITGVVVDVENSDVTEGLLSKSRVTFDNTNWNVAQTIIVTGVDDLIQDGNVEFDITVSSVSDDDSYTDLFEVLNFLNVDDDISGISLTFSENVISETGRNSFVTAVLDSKPIGDVTVSFESSDPTEGSVSKKSIYFSDLNWNIPQYIVVTGVDDSIQDGDVTFDVTVSSSSSDVNYSTILKVLTFTNTDDADQSAIEITADANRTSEDESEVKVSMLLSTQPLSDVTVNISSNNENEGIPSVTELLFTPLNWNEIQEFRVMGVDDDAVDEDQEYSISFAVDSDDSNYEGLTLDDLIFTNTNNDEEITPVDLELGVELIPTTINSLMVQTGLQGYSVFVLNTKGQIVYRRNNLDGNHNISLGSVASRGRYFVMVRKGSLKINKAIILK